MSNDPFTLDMFGNTALSSGLGLGVTAFGSFAPVTAVEPANDDDPDPPPPAPAPASALPKAVPSRPPLRPRRLRANFYIEADRGLPSSWKDRARANVAAILVANNISKQDRPATLKEQAQLIRFTGFGAGELANGMFRGPGEVDFRQGWDELGSSLETAVSEADYASLARCTQYGGVALNVGNRRCGCVPCFRQLWSQRFHARSRWREYEAGDGRWRSSVSGEEEDRKSVV